MDFKDQDIQALYDKTSKEIRDIQLKKDSKIGAEKYINFLKTQIEDLKNYNLDQFLNDKNSIVIAAALYGGMAIHLDEANKHTHLRKLSIG